MTAPLELGSGRYRVLRVLGKGGQKTVYLVHDAALDREVALAWIEGDAEDLERIRREARALAQMGGHPHVVTVFDIGDEGGRPFIVSEHVAGGDLAAELARAQGPLAPARAVAVAADLLDALAAVHERGIVHRDLKPGNVWIDARGRAKLGDFGLALRADAARITQEGGVTGTPAYASPEQLDGGALDGRSDLYALGCVMYELLIGRPPFSGSVVSVISQHLHAVPAAPSALNPDVPPELDRFVLKLLAKSPGDRFASAREAASALGVAPAPPPSPAPVAALAPPLSAVTPTAPELPRVAPPRAGRTPSGAVLALAAVVLALAALVALSRVGADAPPPAAAPVTSRDPEAARLLALGDRLWRSHSLVQATDAWSRAVALDPELAPALLRLALEGMARQSDTLSARQRYRAAMAAAARLDARDRELLEASAPLFEAKPDPDTWRAALERLIAKRPEDGELIYWKAHAELMSGRPEDARATARAAIAADPSFLQPYTLEWSIAEDLGEDREPLLRRCAERFPRSGSCAGALVWLEMSGSDCDQLDRLAKDYAAAVPDHFIGDRGRALAFHARGAPHAAVAELLERAEQHMSPEARELYGTLMAELDIASGDFTAAEAERRAELERVAAVADAGPRAEAVARLGELLVEEGRNDEARALVRDFLEREEALEMPIPGTSFQRLDGRGALLDLAWRLKAGERAALEARRTKLLEMSKDVGLRAVLAWTREDAAQVPVASAMAREPGRMLYLRARAHALAGMKEEAMAELRSALSRCDRLAWALEVPRARLLLFQLSGDPAERARVLDAWGAARPRSVTAEEARTLR